MLVFAQNIVPFSRFHEVRPNTVLADVAVAVVGLIRRPIEVAHLTAVGEFPAAFFVIVVALKNINDRAYTYPAGEKM